MANKRSINNPVGSDGDLIVDPNKAYQALQQMGVGGEEIGKGNYTPPPGRPHYNPAVAKYSYIPDKPTAETMKLEQYEKNHLYEIAWALTGLFDKNMQPVPDAVYMSMPQEQRRSLLQVVVSRSGIKRLSDDKIAWPALLVVVKEIPVIKLICTLDFSKDILQIWQIIFWRNDIGGYEKPLTRGNKPIPPQMAIEFVSRYKQSEGL